MSFLFCCRLSRYRAEQSSFCVSVCCFSVIFFLRLFKFVFFCYLLPMQPLSPHPYCEYRTKGAILRSKSRWYNEGEKNTKYFLNLEKRHFKQGTISQLKLSDGVFVISDKDILSECESFYKDLYASKIENSVNFDFLQH